MRTGIEWGGTPDGSHDGDGDDEDDDDDEDDAVF